MRVTDTGKCPKCETDDGIEIVMSAVGVGIMQCQSCDFDAVVLHPALGEVFGAALTGLFAEMGQEPSLADLPPNIPTAH